MRILDLFCGAGGAAMGYHQAFPDAHILGIDNVPQPDYPFTFIQGDALNPPVRLDAFDFIHASPPCQAYSVGTPQDRKAQHPDLIEPVRSMLNGHRYIIENVVSSPLKAHLMLCGSMFGLQVQRHRYFELWEGAPLILAQACNHKAWDGGRPHTVFGHADGEANDKPTRSKGFKDTDHAKQLMGMPWVSATRGVTEAIPPAYTEWIGNQL